jgi:uncharacterized protein (UPF0333 family)
MKNYICQIVSIISGEQMSIYNDEKGQGSSEYILLFGGIIIIAVAALVIYRSYFAGSSGLKASADINTVRNSVSTIPVNNSTPGPPSQP